MDFKNMSQKISKNRLFKRIYLLVDSKKIHINNYIFFNLWRTHSTLELNFFLNEENSDRFLQLSLTQLFSFEKNWALDNRLTITHAW